MVIIFWAAVFFYKGTYNIYRVMSFYVSATAGRLVLSGKNLVSTFLLQNTVVFCLKFITFFVLECWSTIKIYPGTLK